MICYNCRVFGNRGVALVTVLVFAVVMFTMLKAVVHLATQGTFKSASHFERTAALFLVEAAVADALQEFEKDPGWTHGFDQKRLSDSPGHYTMHFQDTAPFGPTDSVNNIEGGSPVDGFRGPGSVPAHCAELVVTAKVGRTLRQIRVLVGEPSLAEPNRFAVAANGNILMRGDVRVSGLKSLEQGDPVPVLFQSNRAAVEADIIRWQPVQPSDSATIDGEVRVVSPAVDAIDFGNDPAAYQMDGSQTGVAPAPIGRVDVSSKVDDRAGLPGFSFSPTGQNELPEGGHFHDGSLTLNGDLILGDSDLYVRGSLTVNGTIRGRGSVYVAGDTALKGDSRIFANTSAGVGLFSEGNVTLTGYDGSAYVEAVVGSDPEAQVWWQDMTATVEDFKAYTEPLMLVDEEQRQQKAGELLDDNADPYVETLTDVLGFDISPLPHAEGRSPNATGKLRTFLESQAASSTRDFMVARLDYIQRLFADHEPTETGFNPPGTTAEQIMLAWENGDSETYYGWLDAAEDSMDLECGLRLLYESRQLNYDAIGTSYFQGTVYTNGYFLATNEVTIIGSLMTAGDPNSAAPEVVAGYSVKPGDIVLDNNTQIVLSQEFPTASDAAGPSLTAFSWIEL